jgi:hypothetical protein
VSKAREYARENPDKASQTIDSVEAFLAGKAGPKYADKVGKGSHALRSGLGLPAGAGATDSAGSARSTGTGDSTVTSGPADGTSGRSSSSTDGSSPGGPPKAFDPSI